MAVGVVSGLVIFMASAILLLRGGPVVGPTLSLLGNYLFGFEVTWVGAVMGLLEGGVLGFAVGALAAGLRNWALKAYAKSCGGAKSVMTVAICSTRCNPLSEKDGEYHDTTTKTDRRDQ